MCKVSFICVVFVVSFGICLLGPASPAQAELITNGDFEDTTSGDGWGAVGSTNFPPGWVVGYGANTNPARKQQDANAIGGSGTSAFMPKDTTDYACSMQNSIDPHSPSHWVLNWDFASEDPGGAGNRSLHFVIEVGDSNSGVMSRIVDVDDDGDGDLQVYEKSGAGWYTVPGLKDSVIFDTDVESNPLAHRLLMIGHLDQASPSYDIVVTDSSGGVKSVTGLQYWTQGSGTVFTGDGVKTVRFCTDASAGDYLIDNVSLVPEPSTLVLLISAGLGGLLLLWRRRRA